MLKNRNYRLLMVRPSAFQYNSETAANNYFQKDLVIEDLQSAVLKEFDAFVATLEQHDITVDVFEDTPIPVKPDAVFPNNWISMLPDGTITVFPMYAVNRRLEKRQDIIAFLKQNYQVRQIIDLSEYEEKYQYLEGTGSLIFDHDNRMVYAAVSPRTSPEITKKYALDIGYELIMFKAKDEKANEIYHTNVLMAMGHAYCIICLDSLTDEMEKKLVIEKLNHTNKQIIDISFDQMTNFCGNALQVMDNQGSYLLVCSANAYNNFTKEQIKILEAINPIITVNITTIETIGGGSARCMMAENYLRPVDKVLI